MRLFIVIVISVQSCSLGYFVIAYVAAVTYLAVHNKNNARNVEMDVEGSWWMGQELLLFSNRLSGWPTG